MQHSAIDNYKRHNVLLEDQNPIILHDNTQFHIAVLVTELLQHWQ